MMTRVQYLHAGLDAEAGEVLARRVLDELGGSLASSVLEGGPLTIVRAVRLAHLVLRVLPGAVRAKVAAR